MTHRDRPWGAPGGKHAAGDAGAQRQVNGVKLADTLRRTPPGPSPLEFRTLASSLASVSTTMICRKVDTAAPPNSHAQPSPSAGRYGKMGDFVFTMAELSEGHPLLPAGCFCR
jgi:hypothetical protein